MRSSSFCTTGGTEQTKVKPDRSDKSDDNRRRMPHFVQFFILAVY